MRASDASEPRERSGDHGVPAPRPGSGRPEHESKGASERVGGSGGAKPPGQEWTAASRGLRQSGNAGCRPETERREPPAQQSLAAREALKLAAGRLRDRARRDQRDRAHLDAVRGADGFTDVENDRVAGIVWARGGAVALDLDGDADLVAVRTRHRENG